MMLAPKDLVTDLNDQLVLPAGELLATVVGEGGGFLQDRVSGDHFAGNQICADTKMFKRALCLIVRAVRITTCRDRTTWIDLIAKNSYGLIMLLLLESLRRYPVDCDGQRDPDRAGQRERFAMLGRKVDHA